MNIAHAGTATGTGAAPDATPCTRQARQRLLHQLAVARRLQARCDLAMAEVDLVRFNPDVEPDTLRQLLVRAASGRAALAERHAEAAREVAKSMADSLGVALNREGLDLALTPPAPAAVPTPECAALVVLHVTHDRIVMEARLMMGMAHVARREWHRTGTHGFRSDRGDLVDTHEERLGLELCEYVDRLELPVRVAEQLPRRPVARVPEVTA